MQTNNNFNDINYFITNEQNPIQAHVVYNPRAYTFKKLYSEKELKKQILEIKIKINDLIQKANEKLNSSTELFNDYIFLLLKKSKIEMLKKNKIERTNTVEKDEDIKISQEDYYEHILNTLNNFIAKNSDLETRFVSHMNLELNQKLDDELLKTRVDIYETNLTICKNLLEIIEFFTDYFELIIKNVNPKKENELDVNNFTDKFLNKLSVLYNDYSTFKSYVELYEKKVDNSNSIINKTFKTNNTKTIFDESSYSEVCNKIKKCIDYICNRNQIKGDIFKTQLKYKCSEIIQNIKHFYYSNTNTSALTKSGIFQDINEHINITNLIKKSIEDLNAIIKKSGSKIALIALGKTLNGNFNPVNKNLSLKEEEEEKLIVPKVNNIDNLTNSKNIFEKEPNSNLLNKKTERIPLNNFEFKEIDSDFSIFNFYETSGFKKFIDNVNNEIRTFTSKNAILKEKLNYYLNLEEFDKEIQELECEIKKILNSCFENKYFDEEGKLTNKEANRKIEELKISIFKKIENFKKLFILIEENEKISLIYECSNNNLNDINLNNNVNEKFSSYSEYSDDSFDDYLFDDNDINNLKPINKPANDINNLKPINKPANEKINNDTNDNTDYFILDKFNNELETKIADLKKRYNKVKTKAKKYLSYNKFEVEINNLKNEIEKIFIKYFKNGKDFNLEEMTLKEAKEKIKKLEALINSKFDEFNYLLSAFEDDQENNTLDNNPLMLIQDFYTSNEFIEFSNDIEVKMYFLNKDFNKLIKNSNLTEKEISSLNYNEVENEVDKLKENIKIILNNCFEKKEFNESGKITNKNVEEEIAFLKALIVSKISNFEDKLNKFLK